MDLILEERVEKARDLFRQGYNCSQSVFLAYNDLLGVESTLAATISGPLGGGMGRLREVCGAVSGMSLIAGFLAPCPDPAVRQAKAATYALVQEFAERFRAENGASVRRAMFLPLRRADRSSRCPNNRRTPDLSFDTGSNRSHTETAPENRDNRSCRISRSAARCIVR